MALNTAAYLKAAYPPPLPAPRPRCFYLSWDHSKRKTPNQQKHHRLEAIGCQFPNGVIALDNQSGFNSLFEMETALAENGSYEVIWLDEPDQHANRAE